MVERWQAEPAGGGSAAYIEHNALAFSQYSGALYDSAAKKSKRSVRTVLEMLNEAGLHEAVAAYEARVAANPQWAVYVVRRVFKAAIPPSPKAIAIARSKGRTARPTYPTPPRQIKKLFVGSREDAHDYLDTLAQAYGKSPQMVALSQRFWSIPRPRDESKRPFVEEMFVAVFVEARAKQDQRIDFEALWQGVTGESTEVMAAEISVPDLLL